MRRARSTVVLSCEFGTSRLLLVFGSICKFGEGVRLETRRADFSGLGG